ncbi:MAG: hypothetical protein ACI9SQ_001450 [Rubritalea sp.]|jgi:hypothetical protein
MKMYSTKLCVNGFFDEAAQKAKCSDLSAFRAIVEEAKKLMGIQNSEKFNGVVVTFPPVKCEFLKS